MALRIEDAIISGLKLPAALILYSIGLSRLRIEDAIISGLKRPSVGFEERGHVSAQN